MEEYIDKKIKEFSKFCGAVSFDKGTDNYNKMKEMMLDIVSVTTNMVHHECKCNHGGHQGHNDFDYKWGGGFQGSNDFDTGSGFRG